MEIKRSHTSHSGQFRHMRVDSYVHESDAKAAVIMTDAFIENGYWFQIEKEPYSLAHYIAQLGFDVYVLSFYPHKDHIKAEKQAQDLSFREILSDLLPYFHQKFLSGYNNYHYVGHSYGVTMLLCYLMGYRKHKKHEFISDPVLMQERCGRASSFLSLAGLFRLAWPKAHEQQAKLDKNFYWPMEFLFKYFPINTCKQLIPIVPFSASRLLDAPLLGSLLQKNLGRFVEHFAKPLSDHWYLMPSIYFPNANWQALSMALSRGCGDESMEALSTIMSFYQHGVKGHSRALAHFQDDLKHFQLPICFIQGELDHITHPAIIKRYGFEQVGSHRKEFHVFPQTGHQDLLTPKDLTLLHTHIKEWFKSFELIDSSLRSE